MFSFFKKKKKPTTKTTEELGDLFELVQSSTNIIVDDRKDAHLPHDSRYQLAFFVMLADLFSDLQLLTVDEKVTLISIQSIHYAKETGIDVTNIVSMLQKQFASAKEGNRKDYCTKCIYCIEALFQKDKVPANDDYVRKSLSVTLSSISDILKIINQ